MSRSIIHLDADSFFASVEQSADVRLRGKPIAVGGESRGVIASASYEARRFGVKTAMPTSRARKLCPKLIVIPGDYERYERFSRWMFEYAYDFTPDVEIGSIDEGYFDVTGSPKPALTIAATVKTAIHQRLKISVSEGIARNKLVSQIASKLKKPNAFIHVPTGQEIAFLHPLANIWLPGIGPKASQTLNAAGLARIGQIAATPPDLLSLLVGSMAPVLRNFANGVDERPVVPASAPQKSYSHQETFGADQTDEEFIGATLRKMADSLMSKVREDGKAIRAITVRVRYNDMAEDQRSESLREPTDLETDIYGRLRSMLKAAWKRRVSLRLVSLKLSNLYDSFGPGELIADENQKPAVLRRELAHVLDELRGRMGKDAAMRGHDLLLRDRRRMTPIGDKANPVLRDEAQRYRVKILKQQRLGPGAYRQTEQKRFHIRVATVPARAKFVPLNVHSYYDFLNSTLSIPQIVSLAKQYDLPAIAITDPNLHGAVEFFHTCKEAGVKPVIGATARLRGADVRLYVQNREGYSNLCRILSKAGEAGLFEAEHNTQGLIAVSNSAHLANLFPERFYLSISHPHELRRLDSCLPKVLSAPIHYATPDDRWKFDVVQSVRTQTLLKQSHPDKRLDRDFAFHRPHQLRELFSNCPDLLARTLEIADRCDFALECGKPQFPNFFPPDGSTPKDFLRQLVMRGLQQRYPDRVESVRRQIDEELSIISEVGYDEYFLVMWDILQECKRRGIEWITRGSAADSLVCYCLGISGVCPIRFDLYFRRFLNKERMALNKLPDIDVDFPHDRKDEVIDLIFEKYGREHTAVVGGFSTYQARSALGDVAKVLGISEYQIRRVTERLPHHASPLLIEHAIAERQECRDLPINEEPYATAFKMAEFLDGFPRHAKMHPCGVVISRQPIHELVPTFISAKNYPTTHFDMESVEAIGLVKMDILAQGGLAVMRDTRKMLAERSIHVDLDALQPDDPHVWEMISSGGARGVHHIESPAMISLCKMCNVQDIDTLIGIVSVIRPGAANQCSKAEFTRRYQGLSPIVYPHPSLEACLKSSFGLVVYEEQILQICEAFAGLPPGRADVLRRALGKDKEPLIAEIKNEFIACAKSRGRTDVEIENVWKLVDGFRGYAFCKAHSTAYGVEAYQSAWLKRYYPAETTAAILTNGKGFYHPLVYVLESHRLGIPTLPPSINDPGPGFRVVRGEQSKIRVPLSFIKGMSDRTISKALVERDKGAFTSIRDFYDRVFPTAEEMELLIRVGAFDCFGLSRTKQFWESRMLIQNRHDHSSAQGWLLPPVESNRLPELPLEEPTERHKLQCEVEAFGFTVSRHPLDFYENIAWETYCPVKEMARYVGEEITTCGLVIEDRVYHQSNGEPMKFLSIADYTGMTETELFADTYKHHGLATVRYPVLEITGKVEPFENSRGFSLRVLHAGKPRICKSQFR